MSAPPLGTLYALPASLFEGARRLGAAGAAGGAAGAAGKEESRAITVGGDPTTTTAGASPPSSTSTSSSSSAAALDAAEAAGLTCACCGVGTRGSLLPAFASREAQREHFRGDWHRLNARRRAKALPSPSRSSPAAPSSSFSSAAAAAAAAAVSFAPLSEDAAAALLEGADAGDASDVSSLSGSDSEEEEDDDESDDESGAGGRRKRGGGASSSASSAALVPLVSSDGTPFALWRPLLFAPRKASDYSAETAPEAAAAAASSLRGDRRCWAVILAKGGHFAAAVFDVCDPPKRGEPLEKYPRPLAHGTAHRYVVRAKAGGRQSTKDAAGGGAGAIKSAGSSLRRYNERALEADIKKTLAEFGDLLSKERCALIFVHAPGRANSASLFFGSGGGLSPSPSSGSSSSSPLLRKGDPRVRSVPFAVRRPTLSEAGRVARGLLTVHSVSLVEEKGEGEKEGAAAEKAAKQQQRKKEAAAAAAAATAAASAAAAAAATPPPLPTLPDPPLVAASKAGDAELVASLLAGFAAGSGDGEGREGPSRREARPGGRSAYDCASSKAVRDAFRRAAASALEAAEAAGASEETRAEIAAEWTAAGVPSALTPEMEAAQQLKAAEKKARLRAAEKERKKATAAKKAAQVAAAAAEEDAAIEAAAAEAAALSLNKVKKGDQKQQQPQQLSRAALEKREQMAAAAEARLKAASARQQLW